MHEIPRIVAKVQPLEDMTNLLVRDVALLVRRGFLYLLLDPFVVSGLSWLGVSLLVARFNCTLDKNLAIIELPQKPEGINFCLCVAWKTGEGKAERFKLWNNVGERLYAPLYDGRRIPPIFWIEVWSTEDDNATLGETLELKTSLVILEPASQNSCDNPDTQEDISAILCHDNEFELLPNYDPGLGDYWDFDDCGNGTFVNVDDPDPDACSVIVVAQDNESAGGDNFECYVGGADLQGLNAGSAFQSPWGVVGLFTGIKSIENFEEYPDAASLQDQNAGSGWGGAWNVVELS